MLTIGERTYRLVRPASGFHLTLGDRQDLAVGEQYWSFEAHYVPADDDPGSGPGGGWEYWRLMIKPMFFQTNDWRLLSEYAVSETTDFHICSGSAENLLANAGSRGEALLLRPGEFRVWVRDGYFFNCEFDGEIDLPAAIEGEEAAPAEFQLLDEFPFASVTVHVPVNAADPLKSARALAARAINLNDIGRSRVQSYDAERGRVPRVFGPGKHAVTLETAWRKTPA